MTRGDLWPKCSFPPWGWDSSRRERNNILGCRLLLDMAPEQGWVLLLAGRAELPGSQGSSGGAHPASVLLGAAQQDHHHHHCCRWQGAGSCTGQEPAMNQRCRGLPQRCSAPGSPHRQPADSSGPRCWSRHSEGWAWGEEFPTCSFQGGRLLQTPGRLAGFLEEQVKVLGHLGSTSKHPLSALGQCLCSGPHPLRGSVFPAPSGQPGPGPLPSNGNTQLTDAFKVLPTSPVPHLVLQPR